jgi:hypothetical protein
MKRIIILLLLLAANAMAGYNPSLYFVRATESTITVRFICGGQPTIDGITIQWQQVSAWPNCDICSTDYAGRVNSACSKYVLFPGQSIEFEIGIDPRDDCTTTQCLGPLNSNRSFLIRAVANGGFGWTNNVIAETLP